jgi:hypothetical protein
MTTEGTAHKSKSPRSRVPVTLTDLFGFAADPILHDSLRGTALARVVLVDLRELVGIAPDSFRSMPGIVFVKNAARGRVYICEGGPLGTVTLPEHFTDRGAAPATEPLTAAVLLDLMAVVSALRRRLTGEQEGTSVL